MMNVNYPVHIFKAYDIRGIVGSELSATLTQQLGYVLGCMAQDKGVTTMVVGYDGRLSSPLLAKHLISGILRSGCAVYDIGMVTTPLVYFANYHLKTYSGVMVTGSHNPPEYNGFKMVLAGNSVFGEEIKQILSTLIELNEDHNNKHAYNHNYGKTNGRYMIYDDIITDYINYVVKTVQVKKPLSIIIDAGNGVAGMVAPELYRRLGMQVTELFCDVNGHFPNHHPDPSNLANLQDLVNALAQQDDAQLGLAFDGDGDRLGVVTKDGNIIYPDRQMMLFSAEVLKEHPQAKIIYDVKSSNLLAQWIKDHGGEAIMSPTGHSIIKAAIKEQGAMLAGEMSGHIFFNDKFYGYDDGVYAGARLLAILANCDNPSELLNNLPSSVATPEINISLTGDKAFNILDGKHIIEQLKAHLQLKEGCKLILLDGIRVEYPYGFGLVRASNTTPVLVLRFEATTKEQLEHIKTDFKQLLKIVLPDSSKLDF